MNVSAIITMLIICGFVWGGFLFLLSYAIRREKLRTGEGSGGTTV